MSGPGAELVRTALLAQQEILDGMRSGLRTGPATDELLMVAAGGLALLTLLLVAHRYYRREEAGRRAAHRNPLAEAIGVLALTRAEAADLARLASRARLPQPVAMLLSPANLAYAYERGFADADDLELRRRLDALCLKLFDHPLPGAPTDSAAQR